MIQYLVKPMTPGLPADFGDGYDAAWAVLELPAAREIGSLRKAGDMFTAQSKPLRATAETSDPLLALRMVFRTEKFFIEANGERRPLTKEDLR